MAQAVEFTPAPPSIKETDAPVQKPVVASERAVSQEKSPRASLRYLAALRTSDLSLDGTQIAEKPLTAARAVQQAWNNERHNGHAFADEEFDAAKQTWAQGRAEVVMRRKDNQDFISAMEALGLPSGQDISVAVATEFFAGNFYNNFCDPTAVDKNMLALCEHLSAQQAVTLEGFLKPLFSDDRTKQQELFEYLQDLIDAKEISLGQADAQELGPNEAEKLVTLRSYLSDIPSENKSALQNEENHNEEAAQIQLVPGESYTTKALFGAIQGERVTKAFDVSQTEVLPQSALEADVDLLTHMKEEGLRPLWTLAPGQVYPKYTAGLPLGDSRYSHGYNPAVALAAISAENPAGQAEVFQTMVNALFAAHASDTNQAYERAFLEKQQDRQADNPQFFPWRVLSEIEFAKLGKRLQAKHPELYDTSKEARENMIALYSTHPDVTAELVAEASDLTKPENADMLYAMNFNTSGLSLDIDKTLVGIADRVAKLQQAAQKGEYTTEEIGWIGQLAEMYAVLPVIEKLKGEQVDLDSLAASEEVDENWIEMTRPELVPFVEGSNTPIQEVVRMKVGDGEVHVMHGDITALSADAVVCLTNNEFKPYAARPGNVGSIRTKGLYENSQIAWKLGEGISRDVKDYLDLHGMQSRSKKIVPFGTASVFAKPLESQVAEQKVILLNFSPTEGEDWRETGLNPNNISMKDDDYKRRKQKAEDGLVPDSYGLSPEELNTIIATLILPALENVFIQADENGLSSIAMHNIGSHFWGIEQLAIDGVGAQLLLQAYQKYIQTKQEQGEKPKVRDIYLVVNEPADKEHVDGTLSVMGSVFDNLQSA